MNLQAPVSSTPEIYGERYIGPRSDRLARFIAEDLHYLDFHDTLDWYGKVVPKMSEQDRALLGCNDRFFLLTALCGRKDALHPWLFSRCREVEADPDGYLDLWARYHYKSTIGTFAGTIQEILRDPEITIAIMSCTNQVAQPFLSQIMQEFEVNERLKALYSDVLWQYPRKEAPFWSIDDGIVVKRKSNPKEKTVEAFGVIDGMRTGKHYGLLIYDDLITERLVTNPEIILKVTERYELSDNLGSASGTRKWHFGTRYSWADTYGVLTERKTLKERRYPATEDGTLDGPLVFLTKEKWNEVLNTQRSTVSAQMLQNPLAGKEQMFRTEWFKAYEIRPTILNVYIMVDPSKGRTVRSDRTAIAVIGVDVAGNRYLLDGVRHRMQLTERWENLKRLYEKWSKEIGVQLCIVGYERYGAQTEDEVIKLWQERDGVHFDLIELSWPREGNHSKKDRVGRLEPDFRRGRFYLPAVVYHPNIRDLQGNSGKDGMCWWWAAPDLDGKGAPIKGSEKIHYRPYRGPSKMQSTCLATGQAYRVPRVIRALDEDGKAYDVTRALIEEMTLFPLAPKDDLVDAVSRLYDMEPRPAMQFEAQDADIPAYADAG